MNSEIGIFGVHLGAIGLSEIARLINKIGDAVGLGRMWIDVGEHVSSGEHTMRMFSGHEDDLAMLEFAALVNLIRMPTCRNGFLGLGVLFSV